MGNGWRSSVGQWCFVRRNSRDCSYGVERLAGLQPRRRRPKHAYSYPTRTRNPLPAPGDTPNTPGPCVAWLPRRSLGAVRGASF